jgi:hypothetical protein
MRWLLVLLMLFVSPCLAGEEEAIAALKTSGAAISGSAAAGRKLIVVLDEKQITAQRFKRVAEIDNITALVILNHLPKRDELLPIAKEISTLKKLEIGGANGAFNDASLKHVAEMQSLEEAYLSGDFTDKGIMVLAKIKGLKKVTISCRDVGQEAREKLNDALPKCVVR